MTTRSIRLALRLLGLPGLLGLATCNSTATTAVVKNGYGDAVVHKVWWNTTLIADALEPGAASAPQRAVPGDDLAYALISPGRPGEAGPPGLIALQSRQRLSIARGDQLEIDVLDSSFEGNCDASAPLDDASARFITGRIFPGDFAGATYDPATCVTTPATTDAGSDGPD